MYHAIFIFDVAEQAAVVERALLRLRMRRPLALVNYTDKQLLDYWFFYHLGRYHYIDLVPTQLVVPTPEIDLAFLAEVADAKDQLHRKVGEVLRFSHPCFSMNCFIRLRNADLMLKFTSDPIEPGDITPRG